MQLINLHFFVDEKVVSQCIKNFEDVLPGQNKYIIVIPSKDYKLTHVKTQVKHVYAVTYGSEEFYDAIGDLRQYKHVTIHLMTWSMFRFVSEHPECKFTWVTWGSDVYSDLLEHRGYKIYYDKVAYYKALGSYSLLKRIGRATIGKYIKRKQLNVRLTALKNISRICTTNGDYHLLMKYFPEARHIKQIHLGYYPIDVMINNQLINSRIVGNNIFVGNSAYGHGNHVEIFKLLKKIDLSGKKVIVPLSYGDVSEYIIKEGKTILGEHFEPVVDFMPLEEYNKMLLTSNVFIYGNYRQAAAGNIVVALYIGAKVFLNKRNPLLDEYKSMGCILFSIDELEEKINYQLTKDEVEKNRSTILRECSYDHIRNNILKHFS